MVPTRTGVAATEASTAGDVPPQTGRRPPCTAPRGAPGRHRPLRRRPPAQTPSPTVETSSPSVGAVLYPHGEPPLPDAMHVNGERMDLRYVVGVLLGNRDLERRLAAGRSGARGHGDEEAA